MSICGLLNRALDSRSKVMGSVPSGRASYMFNSSSKYGENFFIPYCARPMARKVNLSVG